MYTLLSADHTPHAPAVVFFFFFGRYEWEMTMRLWVIHEKGILGLHFLYGSLVSVFFWVDLNISSGACFKNMQKAPQDCQVLPHRARRERVSTEVASNATCPPG